MAEIRPGNPISGSEALYLKYDQLTYSAKVGTYRRPKLAPRASHDRVFPALRQASGAGFGLVGGLRLARLSYLTVKKFRIVVETRRNRATIVRNR